MPILLTSSQYGARLRIKTVLDPEIDQALVEGERAVGTKSTSADICLSAVPLLLEPFSSPLTQNFGAGVSHLTSLAFAFNFHTPAPTPSSSTGTADNLLSNKLNVYLASLVFRAMLKCFSSLATKYPLVFDARWLDVGY